MNEDKVKALITDMLRMLITYEIELTAYHLVLEKAQERIIQASIPWDMTSNLRKMANSSALQTEAEAGYAPFFGLLQTISPQSLDAALECIRTRIEHQNQSSPPPYSN